MDPVYIDNDNYAMQHMKRRDMYEEGDPHGYARAAIRYESNQPGIDITPPLSPTIPNILPAYHLSSCTGLR